MRHRLSDLGKGDEPKLHSEYDGIFTFTTVRSSSLKRSGMDHTVFMLYYTTLPLLVSIHQTAPPLTVITAVYAYEYDTQTLTASEWTE